jgi:hypothetical protein
MADSLAKYCEKICAKCSAIVPAATVCCLITTMGVGDKSTAVDVPEINP